MKRENIKFHDNGGIAGKWLKICRKMKDELNADSKSQKMVAKIDAERI